MKDSSEAEATVFYILAAVYSMLLLNCLLNSLVLGSCPACTCSNFPALLTPEPVVPLAPRWGSCSRGKLVPSELEIVKTKILEHSHGFQLVLAFTSFIFLSLSWWSILKISSSSMNHKVNNLTETVYPDPQIAWVQWSSYNKSLIIYMLL